MNDYDIYVRSISTIAKSMSLPIEPMTPNEYAAAVAAAERNQPRAHKSLIDMDAFEAAYRA